MQYALEHRRYQLTNEVLNSVTHGIAALMAVAGLVLLLIKGNRDFSTIEITAYAIYGVTLITLFLFSCLYHSLIFTRAKKVFQVFDHCSIFLLIAGTYTPYCLLCIPGWKGILMLSVIWLAGIGGVVYKSLTLHKQSSVPVISTVLYNVMGWTCVLAMPDLYHALGAVGIGLLIAGGVSYSVGSLFYSIKSVKYMHVVWHLFVMLGAGFMFFSIYLYI